MGVYLLRRLVAYHQMSRGLCSVRSQEEDHHLQIHRQTHAGQVGGVHGAPGWEYRCSFLQDCSRENDQPKNDHSNGNSINTALE